VIPLGEFLQHARGGTGIVFGEGQDRRTFQCRAEALEFGAGHSALGERISDYTQIHAVRTGCFSQRGKVSHSNAAIIGDYCRQGTFSSFTDFRDDLLLVFKSDSHLLTPWFRTGSKPPAPQVSPPPR